MRRHTNYAGLARRRSPYALTPLLAWAALAIASSARTADAQGFPAPRTWTGDRSVPLTIDSREQMWNPWGPTEYGPEIRHERMILGSRRIRSIALRFGRMDLNPAGTDDQIRLSWNGTTTAVARTGLSTAPLRVVDGLGFLNAEATGLLFRFDTTAALPRMGLDTPMGGSGAGFSVTAVDATCCATERTAATRALPYYTRVTGILMRGEDSFTVRTPPTRGLGFTTLPVWLSPRAGTSGVISAYARCGAAPTPTVFDTRTMIRDSDGGEELIELPDCSTNVYVTWRNATAFDRAFDFYVGGHRRDDARDRTDIHVGVSWNATETELRGIRHALAQAAWTVYGMSGGSQLVRSYRLFNNAEYCDDGVFLDDHACYGADCDICLTMQDGTSNHNRLGKVTMYRDSLFDSNVYAHEIGHWLMGLPDEYAANIDTCGGETDMTLCHFSLMGAYFDNVQALCTAHNHNHMPIDLRFGTVSYVLTPGCAFGCAGERECCDEPGRCDSRSAWQRIAERAMAAHPARTADNFDYALRFALEGGPSARTDGGDYWNRVGRQSGAGALGFFTRLR